MEISYECRQDLVRADHGVRSMDKLFSHSGALWRRLGRAAPDLRGVVSRHGFCPTDLAREPARHRIDAGSQLEKAFPLTSRIHEPPARLHLGLMINFVTDHSVKLTLSWFESGLCRQTFAFFGSSPARVVEHLRVKIARSKPG